MNMSSYCDHILINSVHLQWYLRSLSSVWAQIFSFFVHIRRQYLLQSRAERNIIRLMSAVGSSNSDGRLMPICSLLLCKITMLESQCPICANLIIYRWYHSRGGVKWEGKTHCAVDVFMMRLWSDIQQITCSVWITLVGR